MVSREELISRFSIWDYVVFAGMLGLSAVIGLYYACSGGKQKTTREFLMADRNMGAVPISLSLLASFMSAITLLGTPAEVYNYTTVYVFVGIGYFFTILVASELYLPVFYNLEVTSAYEYLEKRFSKTIRRIGSVIFTVQMSVYMAIVLYAPALALSQVTGLHVWGSVIAIGLVCTFYTTVGGMKAVMWTDAFQIFIMFGAMLSVFIKGCLDVGGIDVVWSRNVEGQRVLFDDFSFDPRVRHSFWALTVGGFFTWLSVYGVNQAQVQRYLTASSIRTARIALWGNFPGLVGLLLTCMFGGLVIYATYWNCDPLSTKQIQFSDQLVPLFVMDTLGLFPGLPGLFVSGIFSGALSTVSSGMNSLAAVTLEDFVKGCFFPKLSEKRATITSKCLAIFYGALCIVLVIVAEKLGNVLQAALSIFGIIGGPLLGVFTLGMFFPCANSWGAGFGLLGSFAITFWIGLGAQIYKAHIIIPKSPVSIEGCVNVSSIFSNVTLGALNFTSTLSIDTSAVNLTAIGNASSTIENVPSDTILNIYKISYLWYSCIACIAVLVIGLSVSWVASSIQMCFCGVSERNIDSGLFSPIIRKLQCCLPQDRVSTVSVTQNYNSEFTENAPEMQQKVGMDGVVYENGGNKQGTEAYNRKSDSITTTL